MTLFGKPGLSLALIFFCSLPASAVEIYSVNISAPTKANLCKKLGGKSEQPVLTIKHAKVKGERIKIRMYDVLTGAGRNPIEHRKKTVKSDADGVTVVKVKFLPPCNTTAGRRNSSYRFDITSPGSQTVTKRWFSFNSKSKTIR